MSRDCKSHGIRARSAKINKCEACEDFVTEGSPEDRGILAGLGMRCKDHEFLGVPSMLYR